MIYKFKQSCFFGGWGVFGEKKKLWFAFSFLKSQL